MNSNSLPAYRSHQQPGKAKGSFFSRMLQSPAYFSATDLALGDVKDISVQHVDRWVAWLQSSKPLEARQKAGFNSRDDKLRQFAFTSNLSEFSSKFGATCGKNLAIAFTGPIAEQYVGGGS